MYNIHIIFGPFLFLAAMHVICPTILDHFFHCMGFKNSRGGGVTAGQFIWETISHVLTDCCAECQLRDNPAGKKIRKSKSDVLSDFLFFSYSIVHSMEKLLNSLYR
jgi:hypothetical protein